MSAAVSKGKEIQTLPYDAFSNILSFLEPKQIAQAERVCKQWKVATESEGQHVWKEACAIQKIPVVSANLIKKEIEDSDLGLHTSQCGKFTSQILENITAYVALHEMTTSAAVNYKREVRALRADIELYRDTWHFYNRQKNRSDAPHISRCMWGNELPEPFIDTRLSVNKWPVEWGEEPTLKLFPWSVPLRIFMNRDGSFKTNGDEVRVIFKQRPLVLTCIHRFELCDEIQVHSFRAAAETRVLASLGTKRLESAAIKLSKELAKTAPDWFDVDQRAIEEFAEQTEK